MPRKFDLRTFLNASLVTISVELPAYDIFRSKRTDAAQHFHLLIAHAFNLSIRRRLHGDVAQKLQ